MVEGGDDALSRRGCLRPICERLQLAGCFVKFVRESWNDGLAGFLCGVGCVKHFYRKNHRLFLIEDVNDGQPNTPRRCRQIIPFAINVVRIFFIEQNGLSLGAGTGKDLDAMAHLWRGSIRDRPGDGHLPLESGDDCLFDDDRVERRLVGLVGRPDPAIGRCLSFGVLRVNARNRAFFDDADALGKIGVDAIGFVPASTSHAAVSEPPLDNAVHWSTAGQTLYESTIDGEARGGPHQFDRAVVIPDAFFDILDPPACIRAVLCLLFIFGLINAHHESIPTVGSQKVRPAVVATLGPFGPVAAAPGELPARGDAPDVTPVGPEHARRPLGPACPNAPVEIILDLALRCEPCVPGAVVGAGVPLRPAQILHEDIRPRLQIVIDVRPCGLGKEQ